MFSMDNCGIRLIPSNELDKWFDELNTILDSKTYKLLVLRKSRLYEKSISPTEEQFFQCVGNDDVVFED